MDNGETLSTSKSLDWRGNISNRKGVCESEKNMHAAVAEFANRVFGGKYTDSPADSFASLYFQQSVQHSVKQAIKSLQDQSTEQECQG